ncbi:hypothetical protein [Polynucleobacter sp.]|uniref:hypothetical protein n=1 Tax=Polynucleobacter sp. TaxID=2029855 RepID=UPI003F69B477
MSPVEDNLSYQLGLLTASIDASRTDANRRFDTLVSSIGENKKDLHEFKDQVRDEFKSVHKKFADINQKFSIWQGVTMTIAAIPALIIFAFQVFSFFQK